MNQQEALNRTIELAQQALKLNTYPIGSLITDINGNLLAEAMNESFTSNDMTAHAEVLCIRRAGKAVMQKYNPQGAILYSSLETCFGCSFFLRYTNITKVVWALSDPYRGGAQTLREIEKLKQDFAHIKFVAEPDPILRDRSKELMHTYLTQNGKVAAAAHFL